MNCWKCGANNADDCMFCEECGADLRKPPVPPAPNPAQTAGAAPPVPPAPNPAQPVGAPQGQPAASAGQTVTVSIPNPKRMMPFAMRALQFLKQHLLAVILLLVVLVSMATFRSPAVALMPDVTVKPLRSKANAIINLMGSAGGILVLVLGMVFATASVRNALMSYTAYFAVIAAIMLTALVIFLLTVREPEWAAQMVEDSVRYGLEDKPAEAEQLAENADVAEPAVAAEPAQPEKQGLSPEEKKSMIFILLSIVLWFFGYNAVTSKYSVYASNILHKDYNLTLIIAQAAAIISYLPVGMIASKVGRKKTIRAGVIMLAAAFGVAAFLRDNSPSMLMNAMFALAGIAWATINVNSFPMVVEMCSEQDVGRYTGLYYTASMAAQVATPMLSGLLMDKLGMTVLFPYAAVFSALALVSLHFVHHGDSRPEVKKGLDALEDMDN